MIASKKELGWLEASRRGPCFFKHSPVINDDLPAKDLHGQADNYFEKTDRAIDKLILVNIRKEFSLVRDLVNRNPKC